MTGKNYIVGGLRHTFFMKRDAEKYVGALQYVFADELLGYTFYPYEGVLGDVPDYMLYRESFKESHIYHEIKESGKLVKIPCTISDEYKKVLLTENIFNKHWNAISAGIISGINRNKRLSESVPQEYANQFVDLHFLENEYRSAAIGARFTIEYKGREVDIFTQRLKSKRATAMDDVKIKYVYSKKDTVVHDKECPLVDTIDIWNFEASQHFPENRKACPRCKRKLILRSAIGDEAKYFSLYLKFVDKGHVSTATLERFFGLKDARYEILSANEMKVTYLEDTWRIIMKPDETFWLYHNNYFVNADGERSFKKGFHLQGENPRSLSSIMNNIMHYKWRPHVKEIEETLLIKEPKETVWERIMSVFFAIKKIIHKR